MSDFFDESASCWLTNCNVCGATENTTPRDHIKESHSGEWLTVDMDPRTGVAVITQPAE